MERSWSCALSSLRIRNLNKLVARQGYRVQHTLLFNLWLVEGDLDKYFTQGHLREMNNINKAEIELNILRCREWWYYSILLHIKVIQCWKIQMSNVDMSETYDVRLSKWVCWYSHVFSHLCFEANFLADQRSLINLVDLGFETNQPKQDT